MIRIAVIADPHVHDCNWRPAGSGLPSAIRSWGDTIASTRVFNESLPAFRAALTRAAEAGAKIVLLVGDLTDDGQAPNIDAALAVIAECRAQHGLRVLACPGNHDLFALQGRPQDKGFLGPGGQPLLLRSADCPEAATLGAGAALLRMQDLGYRPIAQDLHWESPFGTDPDWAARQYEVVSPEGRARCRMIDASYLIEPAPGLWVLSLDANVAVPRDGATDLADPASFVDPSGTGWTAVLQHRGHLLNWVADVVRRAQAQGKALVAFSHYPPLDVLAGSGAEELRIFGASGLARRIPPPEVAQAIAATGLRLHFSGHLHVNDTARHGGAGQGFFNIAVPAPVGFCPGLKIADLDGDLVTIRTLPLDSVPGHDAAFAAYRAEAAALGQPVPAAADAPDHAAFLDRHLVELVHRRYLPREWPADMAALVAGGRMADLLALLGLTLPGAPDMALTTLAEDWYRLRKGGALAHAHVAPARLAFYHRLTDALPERPGPGLPARLCILLRILRAYLDRAPSGDVTLDLAGLTLRQA